MDLWAPYLFAASYVAQAVVALIAMAVLAGVDLPRPAAIDLDKGRPLAAIVRTPRVIAAAICGIVAYSVMNLIMTSAPLAMHLCGLPVSASNAAIQWHIVAMYGPSFFTGSLIARFGARAVVGAGFAISLLAVAAGLAGITEAHFVVGLILLGLGWNFGFVGASALVLETHRPEERNKVQAFNDFLIFGLMAIGSFSSGHVLASSGWSAVNWIAVPPLLLAAFVLAAAAFARRRHPAPAMP
jgi:predicted MFS family arabinose efflux permease